MKTCEFRSKIVSNPVEVCDFGLVSTTKIISVNLTETQKFDILIVKGMAVVPETHNPLMK